MTNILITAMISFTGGLLIGSFVTIMLIDFLQRIPKKEVGKSVKKKI